jgi:hypothetical protein
MHHVLGHDKVLGRIDHRFLQIGPREAGERIEFPYPLDRIEIQFDSVGFFGVGGINLDGIAPNPEAASFEDGIVSFRIGGKSGSA